jgi:hypothetical protein
MKPIKVTTPRWMCSTCNTEYDNDKDAALCCDDCTYCGSKDHTDIHCGIKKSIEAVESDLLSGHVSLIKEPTAKMKCATCGQVLSKLVLGHHDKSHAYFHPIRQINKSDVFYDDEEELSRQDIVCSAMQEIFEGPQHLLPYLNDDLDYDEGDAYSGDIRLSTDYWDHLMAMVKPTKFADVTKVYKRT